MTNTRKYSKAQESKVAKAVTGKRVANSGATLFAKGDVMNRHFCIECKTAVTEKGSLSIKSDWIQKLKEEMFAMRRSRWALAFNFGGLRAEENYYIISEAEFKEYNELLNKEEQ